MIDVGGGDISNPEVQSLRREVSELKKLVTLLVGNKEEQSSERNSSGVSLWTEDDDVSISSSFNKLEGISLPSTVNDRDLDNVYSEFGIMSPQRPEILQQELPYSPLCPNNIVGLVECSVSFSRKVLNMYGKNMGDDIDHILRQALGRGDCRIEEIDIGKNKLTETSDLSGLSAFSSNELIHTLRANGNPEINLESLLHSLPVNLKTLELGDCGLTETSIAAICDFLPNYPKLTSLSIYANPLIGDGGASYLAQAVARGHHFVCFFPNAHPEAETVGCCVWWQIPSVLFLPLKLLLILLSI